MATLSHLDLRAHWEALKRGKPGHRFQSRYERARRSERKAGAAQRIAMLAGGIVCLVIGAVLVVFPGPAIPFFFLAGGMLATESRTIARFMDWGEVRVRKTGGWAKRRWRRLPAAARVILAILGFCCSGATVYLSYRMMRG